MWGPLIAAIAPVLLGEYMNNNRHRRGPDLEELRRRALAELDPTRISQEAGRQELELLNSPGTHAMRSQLIQAGQMGANAINQRLAQTGLGRSGVGMALESGVRAAPGIQDAMLTSQLLATARDRALQMQKMRADAQMAGGMMPDDPNYMAQMLGAVISAGMGPLIEHSFGKGKTTPKKAQPYNYNGPAAPASVNVPSRAINPTTGAPFRGNAPAQSMSPFFRATMPSSAALNGAAMSYVNTNPAARPFSSVRDLPGFPKNNFLKQLSGPQDMFNNMWNRYKERPKYNAGLDRNFWGQTPYAPTQQWGY